MKLETDFSKVNEIVFDYSKEQEDDSILQNILVLCESLPALSKKPIKGSKKALEFSLAFINNKIDYLEDIQKSFGLPNKSGRFRNISAYLDSLTIEAHRVDPMNDFADKVSSLLDTLYLAGNQIGFILQKHEKI